MAVAYTVATAALALQLAPKWLDNLLSHHSIPGVVGGRQGQARKVTTDALLHIHLTQLIIRDLGVPAAHALALATQLIQTGGQHISNGGLILKTDLTLHQALVLDRLAEAVESAPQPRRGRPRRNNSGV